MGYGKGIIIEIVYHINIKTLSFFLKPFHQKLVEVNLTAVINLGRLRSFNKTKSKKQIEEGRMNEMLGGYLVGIMVGSR